jgi:hypothetical protein
MLLFVKGEDLYGSFFQHAVICPLKERKAPWAKYSFQNTPFPLCLLFFCAMIEKKAK